RRRMPPKPFTCHICGARFNLNNNLKRHLRIHTGEKPFTCKDCGKSFSDNNKLKSHMLVHGARKPFMCDLCGKTFLFNCRLQMHQRYVHADNSHASDAAQTEIFIPLLLKKKFY
uniref:C2H2-type domain-containing protein n=1 Tax=Xiphophorus couchianus TaxID=32473 RepID=A0A3B5LL30_9TELE